MKKVCFIERCEYVVCPRVTLYTTMSTRSQLACGYLRFCAHQKLTDPNVHQSDINSHSRRTDTQRELNANRSKRKRSRAHSFVHARHLRMRSSVALARADGELTTSSSARTRAARARAATIAANTFARALACSREKCTLSIACHSMGIPDVPQHRHIHSNVVRITIR